MNTREEYDGIINKPEIEEVLYHAGFHKYIDKYLGKNGKWIYKYAGQAKSAATGAINKAKTMLPGLQNQATGAVTTAKKKVSSLASTGSKTASGVKKQAQNRISKMLPILSKKLNSTKKSASSSANKLKKQANSAYSSAKKSASSQASKLKKRADMIKVSQVNKLKKQADGTMKSVSSAAKKVKDKNLYQRTKRKVGEKTGKYQKNSGRRAGLESDPRYNTPYSRDLDVGGWRGYPSARFDSHKNNYAQQLAKTKKLRTFYTSKRNTSATRRAKANRKAK